jgi:hypothetical protein
LEAFAETPTAIQIPQHGLGQQVDGLGVFGPLELFLARFQMVEDILQPE